MSAFLIGCLNDNTPEIPVKKLKVDKKINIIGDSTYFRMIDGIRSWDNKFYLVHAEAHQIVILDTNLNFVTAFGEKGKGPGEFVYPTDILKHKQYLYVADGGAGKVSIFQNKNEQYCFEKEFKTNVHTARQSMCFTFFEGQIYTISPHESDPLQILSLNGEKLNSFGQNVNVKTKHHYRNLFYLDSSPEAEIIAVSRSEPLIMHYNKDGKLLNQIDLSALEILQETISINRDFYKTANINSYSKLFSNICLQKNHLYLKMILRDEKMTNTRNKILVLKIKDNKIEPEKILELDNASVELICVSSDNRTLVAFDDSQGELLTFNL